MYYMPTRIFEGEGCVEKNSDALILGTKALIVTGAHSGKASGALDDVVRVLDERNIGYAVYDKIENNPTVECVYAAGMAARNENADFIVAIGGGSPLDASKAAAVYAVNDIEPMAIFDGNFKNTPLPIAAIPTTAGTGSEVTPYSILTLTAAGTKRNFTCTDCFPKAAFLDGRYTSALPLQVTRNTAVDAICHAVESILSKRSTVLSEYVAYETLRLIGMCKKELQSGEFTTEVRTRLLVAASLGGIAISQTGTTIVHSMGYQLTFNKDIPHGMANGLLLGEFLRWCYDVCGDKTDRCIKSFGAEGLDEFAEYISSILPCDVEFSEKDVEDFLDISMNAKLASCPKTVTRDAENRIYTNSLVK